ncbi:YdbH domain-containing protein [Shewanella glacialipiscicola]|uniref:YdbH domain-containing protein n=1 Tax=Shewanella glacialipiscicola TaxID=614069 RepID=UPI0021D93341|nr:YdbH domain-containing protein [Shewanella glacialipiscicola]MCU7993472.1 YdbH domain-containing protein [Shewanella glacialipiscicola]MCU8024789.1 YdbH domain-containing protein [Shewanella glacialipiscicola]
MPIPNKPKPHKPSSQSAANHRAQQNEANVIPADAGGVVTEKKSSQGRGIFPFKKALLLTSLSGILFGAAGIIWIINTQTEKLIMQAANYALSGMDSELIDIHLGNSQLEQWRITSATLRVHDSNITLNNLNIQLKLDWPQSFAELKKYSQLSYLTQKITKITTGDIEVELGESLFLRNRSAIDEQGPAFALDIKSLPLIDIGKTDFILKAQNDLPAYHLVMDKLSLNSAGEVNSEFSHAGESIAQLNAQLTAQEWQLESRIALAPLLTSLHQISLRQHKYSVLSQLSELDQQWQALAIDLQGQLVSHSRLGLISGELASQHRLDNPKVTLNQLASLQLTPTSRLEFKPTVEFGIAGHFTELDLILEPFSLALSPNSEQQQQLMQLLDEPVSKPVSQTSTPTSQRVLTLLSGLKTTEAPMGIALTLTEPLHYPLTRPQQAQPSPLTQSTRIQLPHVQLKTLGSKITTQLDLDNLEIEHSATALQFKTDWHVNADQSFPLKLTDLWLTASQDLGWNSGKLSSSGQFSFTRSLNATDWQFMTAPINPIKSNVASQQPTIQLALEGLKLNSQAKKLATKSTELSLGNISLDALDQFQLSFQTQSAQQNKGASSTPNVTLNARSNTGSTNANASRFKMALPPLALTLTQLNFSQTTQSASTINSADTVTSRSDISAAAFSITSQRGMSFDLSHTETPINDLLALPWSNKLEWQINQLNIDKLLSSKGRSRQETLLKLDKSALTQTLEWKNNTLLGNEHWQVGTVKLQSQHKLSFATTTKPLTLTGQWVVDTSMTEALALLNQTQPVPSDLNITGNNQLQAQFTLTQLRDQAQFAMQITQSMTELNGFYKDIIFEGGKLQAQCEFTWGLSRKQEAHKNLQDKGNVSSLSKLNCPQTLMTFNLFNPGFPLTDIEVAADIALSKDAAKLPDNWIQQLTGLSDTDVSMTAKGKVLSGQFLLPEFSLKLQDKSHAYLLLQGMSLEEVLRIQPQTGIYADGIFDGVLPVDLVDGKVSITGGQLAARAPGGLIAISGNPSVEQMRQSQQYLDFVFSTMEHLQYSQLSSSFDMNPAWDAKLLVEVKGRSQGVERPIHLNYSHEENMLQLFKSLQIGNDLQDRIEKSVK